MSAKYAAATLFGLISIGINVWIIYQTRNEKNLAPKTKKKLENISYILIFIATLILTFA